MSRHYIECIGTIWLPPVTAAMAYTVSDYDIENMRDDAGDLTRDSVERWLSLNSGDFQGVDDFHAVLPDGVEIPWQSEESELTFGDCMYPAEEA